MPTGSQPNQTQSSRGDSVDRLSLAAWKRRALQDAIVAAGIGLFFVCAVLVLVGIAGEIGDQAPTTIGPFGQSVALVLAVAALAVLLGGSWYIARRLRDLQSMDRDNRRLGEALLDAAEAERTRLGQNLHDDLGQHLTAIGMLSAGLRRRLDKASAPLAADAAKLAELAEEAAHRTRLLTRACLIDWTERAGLVRSLGMLGDSASELFGFPVDTTIDERLDAPDPAIGSHIARIVSEAINNAVRHADPSRVSVTLRPLGPHHAGRCPQEAELLIEDHARECPSATDRHDPDAEHTSSEPGLGMLIMHARARAIGAELEVFDRDPQGMTIRCVFPWKPARTHRGLSIPQVATVAHQMADQSSSVCDRVIPVFVRETEPRDNAPARNTPTSHASAVAQQQQTRNPAAQNSTDHRPLNQCEGVSA